MNKKLMFLLFCTSSSFIYSMKIRKMDHSDVACLKVIDDHIEHTGTDAYIKVVSDGAELFILKQISDEILSSQFLLISDVVASTLGRQAHIPVNEVRFIPYNVGCGIKKYPDRAATLHTFVAGKDLEQVTLQFIDQKFTLQQRRINPESPWQIQHPLAEYDQGFIKAVIESMSCHKDLALLIAFDTFISNSDRSFPNIFYDTKSNHFWGIDQAAAFRKGLAQHAINRIQEYKEQNYFNACDAAVLDGIWLYCETLELLVSLIKPEEVQEAMEQLVSYLHEDAATCGQITWVIQNKSNFFKDNYKCCLLLIESLHMIMSNRLSPHF